MKSKIKIVVSEYHYNDVTERMLDTAKEHYVNSNLNFDVSHVPGSFEIPFEIARSIKEDTIRNEDSIGSFRYYVVQRNWSVHCQGNSSVSVLIKCAQTQQSSLGSRNK